MVGLFDLMEQRECALIHGDVQRPFMVTTRGFRCYFFPSLDTSAEGSLPGEKLLFKETVKKAIQPAQSYKASFELVIDNIRGTF